MNNISVRIKEVIVHIAFTVYQLCKTITKSIYLILDNNATSYSKYTGSWL